ncbi:MAG: PH domain-containing protein [Patescibacteria group bacterium]
MFRNNKCPIELSENEKVIVCIVKHWIKSVSFTVLLLLSAIIILGGGFFLFYSYLNRTGKFIFLAIFLFLLISVLVKYHENNKNRLYITNQRIANIDLESLFRLTISEIHYDKIQSVSTIKHGIFRIIFNVGDIIIKTGAEKGDIVISSLPRPAKIQSLILDLQQKYINNSAIVENENTEERETNPQVTELLDYLKSEDKEEKNNSLKIARSSKSDVWKTIIKEYLEKAQDKRIDREPSYFKKKRDEKYDQFIDSLKK